MSLYTPDRWVMLEFTKDGAVTSKKVLAGWHGGYTGSDSWKLSSGVISIEDRDDYWEVTNHSGSIYRCYKKSNGMNSLMMSMLSTWKKQVKADSALNDVQVMNDVF